MDTHTEPEIPAVSVEEAARRLANGVRLLDVREQNEWDEAHIEGTELMPMSTINDWYADVEPGAEILVFCRSGSRSAKVAHALITQAGFTNVTNVAGGIVAWHKADLPLVTLNP